MVSVPTDQKPEPADKPIPVAVPVGSVLQPAQERVPARADVVDPRSGEELRPFANPPADQTKLIAFYLPQFHPIPENDRAWGKGFTEWTNVTKASPLFEGHHQPQLPGELGFYDLRVPQVMEQQANLAKAYGVYGFCYYYYWFDGQRLLEKPLDLMLSNQQLDMPFCLCWANENWTRRWDGSDDEILVSQTFSSGSWRRFIDDLAPYLEDKRYIRIGGRPLLLVYRADIIPNLRESVQMWRDLARAKGFDLFIAACLTFGFNEPMRFGFDAGVEFPPHGTEAEEVRGNIQWSQPFKGRVYSYADAVTRELTKSEKPYKAFRTAMVSWDNTARRGARGHLYHEATPELFEAWLSALVIRAQRRHPPGERLVFINAWNEWAEGAHLEPDQKFGRQWLAACSRATNAGSIAYHPKVKNEILTLLEERAGSGNLDGAAAELLDMLRASEESARSLEAVNVALSKFYMNWLETSRFNRAVSLVPSSRLKGTARITSVPIKGWIDSPAASMAHVNRGEPCHISGWICPLRNMDLSEIRCIVSLMPVEGHREPSFTLANHRIPRSDVASSNPELPFEQARLSGFEAYLDLRPVDPGEYIVLVGLADTEGVSYMQRSTQLFVS